LGCGLMVKHAADNGAIVGISFGDASRTIPTTPTIHCRID
jgi:hypothetical protein